MDNIIWHTDFRARREREAAELEMASEALSGDNERLIARIVGLPSQCDYRTDKQILCVLNAAQSGCNTTKDIADKTGLSVNVSSHWVSELIKSKTLKRNGIKRRVTGRGGEYLCFEVAG